MSAVYTLSTIRARQFLHTFQTGRFPNVGWPALQLSQSFRQNDSEASRLSPCLHAVGFAGSTDLEFRITSYLTKSAPSR
jgi:hypothetical protein